MAVSPSTVLRVRGLPSNINISKVTGLLECSLRIAPEACGLKITSLAEDPYQVNKQVATLMFLKEIPPLFTTSTTQQWSIKIPKAELNPTNEADQTLTFDTHFHGLTALNMSRVKEAAVDCVAVCGLGVMLLVPSRRKESRICGYVILCQPTCQICASCYMVMSRDLRTATATRIFQSLRTHS